ncbi:MAG: hypothetical protein ACOCQD_04260 [archaeon]
MNRSKYFVYNAIRVLCLVPIIVLSISCGVDKIEIENSSSYDLILEFETEYCDSVKSLAYLIWQESQYLDYDSITRSLLDTVEYKRNLKQIKENYSLGRFYHTNIEILDSNDKIIFNPRYKLEEYYKDTLSIVDELLKNPKFVLFLPAGGTFKSFGGHPSSIVEAFPHYQEMNIYYDNHFIGCLSLVSVEDFGGPHFKDGKLKIEIENNHIKALINRNNKYYN